MRGQATRGSVFRSGPRKSRVGLRLDMECAREFFHDITDIEKDMHMLVRRIFDRYGRLEARLQRAVQGGQTICSIQDLISREDQLDLL